MESAEHTQRKPDPFPILNRLCILLLLGALVALFSGVRYGTFGAPETRNFLALHILLTIAGLATPGWRSFFKDGDTVGGDLLAAIIFLACASVTIAGLNVYLAVKAVLEADTAHRWIIGAGPPGLLGLWKFIGPFFPQHREQRETPTTIESERGASALETLELASVAAEESRPDPADTLHKGVQAAVAQSVSALALVLFSLCVLLYLSLAQGAFFADHAPNWSKFFADFYTAVRSETFLVTYLPLGPLVIGCGTAVLASTMEASVLARRPDADRDLTPGETQLIRDAMIEMRKYYGEQAPGLRAALVYWAPFVVFLMVILAYAIFIGTDFVAGDFYFQPARTKGLDWFLYRDGPDAGDRFLIAPIIGICVFMLSLVPLFWPALGLMRDQYARRSIATEQHLASGLRGSIARSVRLRVTTDLTTLQPLSILKEEWRTFASRVGVAAGAFLIITTGVLFLDRMDYLLVSDNGIDVTDYWTLKKRVAGYDEIETIEILCKTNLRYPQIQYSFLLSSGEVIEIGRYTGVSGLIRFDEEYISLLRADAKAREAGAAIDAQIAEDCFDELSALGGEEFAKAARLLLQP